MAKPMGLSTPFSLTRDGVSKAVTLTSPGAYALGYLGADNVFQIAYVGRSDDNVASRLMDHVSTPHAQFCFTYLGSSQAAFLKECSLYHDFNPPENTIHPAKPKGSNLTCPNCGYRY